MAAVTPPQLSIAAGEIGPELWGRSDLQWHNSAARELGADALEQLGYQSEAATWRNAYLAGAMELRGGVLLSYCPGCLSGAPA